MVSIAMVKCYEMKEFFQMVVSATQVGVITSGTSYLPEKLATEFHTFFDSTRTACDGRVTVRIFHFTCSYSNTSISVILLLLIMNQCNRELV